MCAFGEFVDHDDDHVPLSFSRSDEWSSEIHSDCVPSPGRSGQRLVRSVRVVGGFVELALHA